MSEREIDRIVNNFRAGNGMSSHDEAILRQGIINGPDGPEKSGLIYIYSYSFPPNEEIRDICLSNMYKSLDDETVAKSILAVSYYWQEINESIVQRLLEISQSKNYEDWFDTYQSILRVYNDNPQNNHLKRLSGEMRNFSFWAKDNGYDVDVSW